MLLTLLLARAQDGSEADVLRVVGAAPDRPGQRHRPELVALGPDEPLGCGAEERTFPADDGEDRRLRLARLQPSEDRRDVDRAIGGDVDAAGGGDPVGPGAPAGPGAAGAR